MLWTKRQFPEGTRGACNWDLLNLAAAQQWACPCKERNCLTVERFPKEDALCDFHKSFQTKRKCLRDSFRDKFLEPAYFKQQGTRSRASQDW